MARVLGFAVTREDLARAAQEAYVQALSSDPPGRWLAVVDAVQGDATQGETTDVTEELLDALSDVINQACGEMNNDLNSGAMSAYARGIRTLARFGRVRIQREVGRVVIAEWIR